MALKFSEDPIQTYLHIFLKAFCSHISLKTESLPLISVFCDECVYRRIHDKL